MANNENLIGKGFESRSTNELREIQSRGGKASGEARRKKADFRKALNAFLTAEIDSPEWTPILEAMGIDNTLESVVNMAMIKQAMSGNVKAYEAIAKYSGQAAQTDADLEEQRIRTDRARRARDQEIGNTDNTDGVQSFLKAMQPTQEELDSLFTDNSEEEDEGGVKEAEETGDI